MTQTLLSLMLVVTQVLSGNAVPLFLCLEADGSFCVDFGPAACGCCAAEAKDAHAERCGGQEVGCGYERDAGCEDERGRTFADASGCEEGGSLAYASGCENGGSLAYASGCEEGGSLAYGSGCEEGGSLAYASGCEEGGTLAYASGCDGLHADVEGCPCRHVQISEPHWLAGSRVVSAPEGYDWAAPFAVVPAVTAAAWHSIHDACSLSLDALSGGGGPSFALAVRASVVIRC